MVDLGGYVIIIVETKDKKIKLYGSPADKADLEVADEILEVNGKALEEATHTEVIAHIHQCIRSRTICLRVKRRSGNKLAVELAQNSSVQDAFVIAVEQQARERLERLSALRRIQPVDMTKLSHQLSQNPMELGNIMDSSPIYVAAVPELRSSCASLRDGAVSGSGTTSPSRAQTPRAPPPSPLPPPPPSPLINGNHEQQEEEGETVDQEMELTQELLPDGPANAESVSRNNQSQPVTKNALLPDVLPHTNQAGAGEEHLLHAAIEKTISVDSLGRLAGMADVRSSMQRLKETMNKYCPSMMDKLTQVSALVQSVPMVRALLTTRALALPTPPNALRLNGAAHLRTQALSALAGCGVPDAAELAVLLGRMELEGLMDALDQLVAILADRGHNDTEPESPMEAPGGVRLVRIHRSVEPLGATVRNEGEAVVIGRVLVGGSAERTGMLRPGDELLEVNGVRLRGLSVHEVCDVLSRMSGSLTFAIVPASVGTSQSPRQFDPPDAQSSVRVRALYTYDPGDDPVLPCRELGLPFKRGEILRILNQADALWWQAVKEEDNPINPPSQLSGLVPSAALYHQRQAAWRLQEQLAEAETEGRSRSQSRKSTLLCAKTPMKKRKKPWEDENSVDDSDIPGYEEVTKIEPFANCKRPVVLLGPPGAGRHELRQRLLKDQKRFAAAVPHTTRPQSDGEVDGQDYHFISRAQFETMASEGRFVEHGEFERNLYGTGVDAVRHEVSRGRTCVLNMHPASLERLRNVTSPALMPFAIMIGPPPIHILRTTRPHKKEEELEELVCRAQEMEQRYGHLLDMVLVNTDTDRTFQLLLRAIERLDQEPQWVPVFWLQD